MSEAKFIEYLSKKDFDKCRETIKKMKDDYLVSRSIICLSLVQQTKSQEKNDKQSQTFSKPPPITQTNKSELLKKQEQKKIGLLNQRIQLLQRLKGYNFTLEEEEKNQKLCLLSLLQKKKYSQAVKLGKHQFIEQLIEYEQLKKLFNLSRKNQRLPVDTFEGSSIFQNIKQRVIGFTYPSENSIHNQLQMLLARVGTTDDPVNWQRSKNVNLSIFKKIYRTQEDIRRFIDKNNEIGDSCDRFNSQVATKGMRLFNFTFDLRQNKQKKPILNQSNILEILQAIYDNVKILSQEMRQKNTNFEKIFNLKLQNIRLSQKIKLQQMQIGKKRLQPSHEQHNNKNHLLEEVKTKLNETTQKLQMEIKLRIKDKEQSQEKEQRINSQMQQTKNQLSISRSTQKAKQDQIKRLIDENASLKSQNGILKSTTQDKQRQFNTISRQIVQIEQSNTKVTQTAQARQQQITRQFREQIETYRKQIENMKQTINKQAKKYKQLEDSREQRKKDETKLNQSNIQPEVSENQQILSDPELNQTIKQLKEDNAYLSKQLQDIKAILQDKHKECSRLTNQIQKLNHQRKIETQKLSESSQQIIALKKQLRSVKEQKESLKKKLKSEQQNVEQQTQQIQNLNRMLEELQTQLQQKQQRQKQQDLTHSQSEIKQIEGSNQLRQRVRQVQQQNTKLRKNIIKDKQQRSSLEKELQRFAKDNEELKVEFQREKHKQNQERIRLLQSIKDLKQELSSRNQEKLHRHIKEQQGHRCISHLFTAGEVFEEGEDERLHLIRVLEQQIGPIHRTKLLYAFDPLNKVNFHRYIDNHAHLLVIAKTALGKHIAAYSESQLSADGGFRGMGLLMPLWDLNSVFHLIPGKKSVSYDDYFLIYGNSELRIRSQECKVFSNFGIANSYFDNQRKRVQHFLGDSQREIDLTTYEIYQVIFQRDLA